MFNVERFNNNNNHNNILTKSGRRKKKKKNVANWRFFFTKFRNYEVISRWHFLIVKVLRCVSFKNSLRIRSANEQKNLQDFFVSFTLLCLFCLSLYLSWCLSVCLFVLSARLRDVPKTIFCSQKNSISKNVSWILKRSLAWRSTAVEDVRKNISAVRSSKMPQDDCAKCLQPTPRWYIWSKGCL